MTTTWKIENMERQATDGGVITAHWRATAQDGEYTATVYGSMGFSPDPAAPGFIPFDDLTEAIVIGWVKDAMGEETVAAHEAGLAAQLERLANPPVLAGTPW